MSRPSFLRKRLRRPRTSVTSQCEAAVLLEDAIYLPAFVMLRYTAKEPYTVRMDVSVAGARVEWVFGRDLLIQGVDGPAGLGAVQVWPTSQPPHLPEADNDIIIIKIGTRGAEATLVVPATVVRAFVERTQETVAAGTEGGLLRLDEDIVRLMGGGAQA
jgi:hypothetical protein